MPPKDTLLESDQASIQGLGVEGTAGGHREQMTVGNRSWMSPSPPTQGPIPAASLSIEGEKEDQLRKGGGLPSFHQDQAEGGDHA